MIDSFQAFWNLRPSLALLPAPASRWESVDFCQIVKMAQLLPDIHELHLFIQDVERKPPLSSLHRFIMLSAKTFPSIWRLHVHNSQFDTAIKPQPFLPFHGRVIVPGPYLFSLDWLSPCQYHLILGYYMHWLHLSFYLIDCTCEMQTAWVDAK